MPKPKPQRRRPPDPLARFLEVERGERERVARDVEKIAARDASRARPFLDDAEASARAQGAAVKTLAGGKAKRRKSRS